jgi:hypothetical protein
LRSPHYCAEIPFHRRYAHRNNRRPRRDLPSGLPENEEDGRLGEARRVTLAVVDVADNVRGELSAHVITIPKLDRKKIACPIECVGHDAQSVGTTHLYCYTVTNGASAMGLIELIVTICALSAPRHCEDLHLSFSAGMSLNQCVMHAQPYIAQWINEHPKWVAMRWRCDYGGSKEKT